MSRFSDQLARGLDRLREQAGKTITYTRGASSVSLTAVVGQSAHEQLDETGMPITAQSRDYLIKASSLVLASVAVLPQQGDEITDSGATFAVRSVGSEAPWRYSDLSRTTIRVHTVEVS